MVFVLGFLIAVAIALTGVGAGVFTAPMLILFLHVPVEIAVSTALAYSAITKLIVVPIQLVRRQVSFRVLGFMLMGGLPGVVIGSLLFKHFAAQGQRSVLYIALGTIIVFSAGWNIWRHFHPGRQAHPPADHLQWVAATMLPIGAEAGLSSSGAGALGTVSLLGLTSLSAAQVVGTDLAFGFLIALAGTGVHLFGSTYDALLLLKLAAGGVAGAVIGSGAAPLIPSRQLRFALSVWLLFIGVHFCYQAATH